jgi:hypothetical protein
MGKANGAASGTAKGTANGTAKIHQDISTGKQRVQQMVPPKIQQILQQMV